MTDETIRLSREFLGKEYHVGPQVVDPGSIRKYALATNEKNPRYLDTESDAELIAPPIYPVVFLPDILSQLRDDSEQMKISGINRIKGGVYIEHCRRDYRAVRKRDL